ncbi:MAG: adenylate/guanylate cyclase domain-containing protein [Flavobacteriaceae bacterium]
MHDERLLKEVNTIIEQVSEALDADRSTLFLYKKDSNSLVSIRAQGLDQITLTVPLGKGMAGETALKGQPLILNDVPSGPEVLYGAISKILDYQINRAISVPIFDERQSLVGVLQAFNKHSGKFTDRDLGIMEAFAHTLSLLIKNTFLYYTNEVLKDNLSTLLDVFGTVSSELDLDALIPVIMSKAAEITKSDRSSLFILDPKTGELWTKYAKGLGTNIVRTKVGIVAQIANKGMGIIVNDPYNHRDFDPEIDLLTGYRTQSIMGVPLLDSKREVLGVIQAINKKEGAFNKDDLAILEGFSNQIRIALENAQLFGETVNMKNYLDVLVENLDNGIVTINNAREIQTINQTFQKMFNLDAPRDFIGVKLHDLEPGLSDILGFSKKAIESGEKHYEYGLEFVSKTDKKTITNLSVLPMQDDKGEIIGAVNVFQDITKEKRIRSNLSRYIPKHLVNQVMNRDDLSVLKGKSRKCSILFSDIRNFTRLTEELGAIQIVELLNGYFNNMVHVVHGHNGVLDKFIGDAIMAVFGVPYTNTSDPLNAVRCALEMQKIINRNHSGDMSGIPLKVGIGISTGNVVSGNIGSERRFEYTVIGDSVNLAARLEGETKKYGVDLLICENTYQAVTHQFLCRELDTVIVKGKQTPVNIYTVYGERQEGEPTHLIGFNTLFSEGLGHYRSKKYRKAKICFEKAKALNPLDRPTNLFLERIKYLAN